MPRTIEKTIIAAALRDYQSGLSSREASARHGISHPTVVKYALEAGILRKRGNGSWHWPAVLASQFQKTFTTLPDASRILNRDKGNIQEALRAGHFHGAFQWPETGWWFIPRSAIEEYARTHPLRNPSHTR